MNFLLIFSHRKFAILIATALIISCGGKQKSLNWESPPLQNFALKHSFKEGSLTRYNLSVEVKSPAGENMLTSRSMIMRLREIVRSVNKNGVAAVETVIEDVVFENSSGDGSTGLVSIAIANGLKEKSFLLNVTPAGKIEKWEGEETRWANIFSEIFEGTNTNNQGQKFTIKMAELNFSRIQIFYMLALIFVPFPEHKVESGTKWEENRSTPLFGMDARTNIVYQAEEFVMKENGKMALKVTSQSDNIEGELFMDLPSDVVPLQMAMNIEKANMAGKIFIDPLDGSLIELSEKYNLVVKVKHGLPSLNEGNEISRVAGVIKIPVEVEFVVKKIKENVF